MLIKRISNSRILEYTIGKCIVILFSICTAVLLFCNDSFCAELGTYHVELQGIKDKNLADKIRSLSRTLEMSEKPRLNEYSQKAGQGR